MPTHDVIEYDGWEGITLWYGNGVDLDELGRKSKKTSSAKSEKNPQYDSWPYEAVSLAVFLITCGLGVISMLSK
jgi:hypothetical protein